MAKPKPLGYVIRHHPDKPYKGCEWRMLWYEDGKRKQKWYKTEREVKKEAADRNIEQAAFGSKLSLDVNARFDAARAVERLKPYGKTLADAVDFYVTFLEKSSTSVPVTELVDEVLAEYERQLRAGETSKRNYQTLKDAGKKLKARFGSVAAKLLDGSEVIEWLKTLKGARDEKPLAIKTRNKLRTSLHTIFSVAVGRKRLPANPLAGTKAARNTAPKPVKLLTPSVVEDFLEAVNDDYKPFFAIAAFSGLRIGEVERLDWSEIRLEDRVIVIPASKTKTRKQRSLEITDNLLEWLKPRAKKAGPVKPNKQLQLAREKACTATGIDWDPNVLRHSFCSYGVAWVPGEDEDDAGKGGEIWVHRQAGHSLNMLESNYKNVVSKHDAELYFDIYPPGEYSKYKTVEEFPANRMLTDDEMESLRRTNFGEYHQRKKAQGMGWTLAKFRAEKLSLAAS